MSPKLQAYWEVQLTLAALSLFAILFCWGLFRLVELITRQRPPR